MNLLILSLFSDFFPLNNSETLILNLQTILTISQNYFILNSFFNFIGSTNNGAITIKNINCILVIENSLFNSCFASSAWGGAILFDCTTNGNCILNKICGYNCYSANTYYPTGWGQFCCIRTSNPSKNEGYYLSITFCSPQSFERDASMLFSYGIQKFLNINSSFNHVHMISGINCHNSNNISLEYCTISNNFANSNRCIHNYNSNMKINKNNIINNTQTSNTLGIVTNAGGGSLQLYYSIFYQNDKQYLFSSDGYFLISNFSFIKD